MSDSNGFVFEPTQPQFYAARYKRLFEHSHDPILLHDLAGRVVDANRRAMQALGYRREALVGMRLQALFPPRVHEDLQEHVQRAATREALSFETELLRYDGSTFRGLVIASRIPGEGTPLVQSVIRELEDTQAATSALRIAKDAAESANELKSQFLATMSHEVRTPLTTILGVAELLLEGAVDHNVREQARILHRNAASLRRMLDDVLDFSKLDAGHLQMESAPFDLRDVLEGTVEDVAVGGVAPGVDVLLITANDLPQTVNGDAQRLRQVLTNLVHNAVKFTTDGAIRVHVSTDGQTPPSLRIAVEDTGPGMPEEQAARVFERFYQAGNSSHTGLRGAGLGLSICKSIVDLMGGRIRLHSQVGVGTVVRVVIPLDVLDAAPTPVVRAGLFRQRALVVCDRPLLAQHLAAKLEHYGMTVERVASAGQLLAQATEGFDIVYVDHRTDPVETIGRVFGGAPVVRLVPRAELEHLASMDPSFLSLPIRDHRLERSLHRLLEPETAVDPVAPVDSRLGTIRAPIHGRVAVVEDCEDTRLFLRKALESFGCAVDIYPDGASLLEAIESSGARVVLSDFELPGMNGEVLARCLRRRGQTSLAGQFYIIGISAHVHLAEQEQSSTLFDRFLSKPCTLEELYASIHTAMAALELADARDAQRRELRPRRPTAPSPAISARPSGPASPIASRPSAPYPASTRPTVPQPPTTGLSVLGPDRRAGYLDRRADELSSLRDMVANQDVDGLLRMAHMRKGSAAMYGFEALGAGYASLYDALQPFNPARAEQAVRVIADLVASARQSIVA